MNEVLICLSYIITSKNYQKGYMTRIPLARNFKIGDESDDFLLPSMKNQLLFQPYVFGFLFCAIAIQI